MAFRNLSSRIIKIRNPPNILLRNISGEAREIEIPVPYGKIAGRSWGDPSGKPILGLHGWLDNAGTFDHLAPLIDEGYHLVSIDQPGHGFTSKYPAGMMYKMSDGFVFIRKVLDYLQWEKTIIMGHSMGGGLGLWYSAMFPDQVQRIISIDILSFGALPLNKHVKTARTAVIESVKIQKKLENPQTPSYSFEDGVARAFMASNLITRAFLPTRNETEQISEEAVRTLMKRGLVELADGSGYTWSADLRLRIPTAFNMDSDMTEEFASQVRCPHLVIKGTDSPKYMSDEDFTKLQKIFRKNNPSFVYRELEGGHHLHLNTPKPVAKIINEFLAKDFPCHGENELEGKPQFDL